MLHVSSRLLPQVSSDLLSQQLPPTLSTPKALPFLKLLSAQSQKRPEFCAPARPSSLHGDPLRRHFPSRPSRSPHRPACPAPPAPRSQHGNLKSQFCPRVRTSWSHGTCTSAGPGTAPLAPAGENKPDADSTSLTSPTACRAQLPSGVSCRWPGLFPSSLPRTDTACSQQSLLREWRLLPPSRDLYVGF